MKSVNQILFFLVLGVCIIKAIAYPAFPIDKNQQQLDYLQGKFSDCGLNSLITKFMYLLSVTYKVKFIHCAHPFS
jgi:hypothetical protein